MLIQVGREKDYTTDKDLKPLKVIADSKGNIVEFPKVEKGWQVACSLRVGMNYGSGGVTRVYICQALEDMQTQKEVNERMNHGQHSTEAPISEIIWYAVREEKVKALGYKLDSSSATLSLISSLNKTNQHLLQTQSSSTLFQPAPRNFTTSPAASLGQEIKNKL